MTPGGPGASGPPAGGAHGRRAPRPPPSPILRTSSGARHAEGMGKHSKPDPPLTQGNPPPDNADSRVDLPPAGTGAHAKPKEKKD